MYKLPQLKWPFLLLLLFFTSFIFVENSFAAKKIEAAKEDLSGVICNKFFMMHDQFFFSRLWSKLFSIAKQII